MKSLPFEVQVFRHFKENRRKCSLEPLRGRPGFDFRVWKPGQEIRARGHLLLEFGAPLLRPGEAGPPLLLLDSTWRYLPPMRRAVRGEVLPRSLPPALRTAYPRTSKIESDPEGGLASIEALYVALRILGHRDDSLLEGYHWREAFLLCCEEAGVP